MGFTVPIEPSPGSDACVEPISVGTDGICLRLSILFLHLGIPDNLNDVLIRRFMKSFAVARFQAALVASFSHLGYLVCASSADLITPNFGYKPTMIPGSLLFLVAACCFSRQPCSGDIAFS